MDNLFFGYWNNIAECVFTIPPVSYTNAIIDLHYIAKRWLGFLAPYGISPPGSNLNHGACVLDPV